MPLNKSQETLAEKLGLKRGIKLLILNPIENMFEMLSPLHEITILLRKVKGSADLALCFFNTRKQLDQELPRLEGLLRAGGVIWICWPAAENGFESSLDESYIRQACKTMGLLETETCRLDGNWSGIKFVPATMNDYGI